ncbi:MAG: PQQ-dependent sugar dehydrogenase, partial [Bacteroidota bacterium]
MKSLHSKTTHKILSAPGRILLVIFLIGTTAFLPMKIMNYGISNPSPIAAYLNGNFPDEAPSSTSSWTAEVAYPNLTFTDPIQLLELPGTNKFIMAGKKGRLWTFDKTPSTNTKTTVLNIESKILTSGDAGLMGMALHPEFGQAGSPNRGYLYIWSRQKGPTSNGNLGYVVLSRYNWPDGANTIDANSEFIMIKQYDRHQWHNGGGMFFGLDGFLYISSGDEGGANDQYNTGQKINVGLLAGALRIDVDKDPSRSHAIRRQPLNPANPPNGWPNSFSQGYFVPNDNPWQDVNGTILEEFYAIGFRSPHRMTQDPQTGDIWMGDV